jgi:hypothetical protein
MSPEDRRGSGLDPRMTRASDDPDKQLPPSQTVEEIERPGHSSVEVLAAYSHSA